MCSPWATTKHKNTLRTQKRSRPIHGAVLSNRLLVSRLYPNKGRWVVAAAFLKNPTDKSEG